jgi:GrpB-like predicted nucleotidyltransferase (UPF0157 family)
MSASPGRTMHTDEAPIHISTYDPAWPSLFEGERELLAGVLEPWLVGSIEHVGSTAVPGLSAKPVIDIMAGVASLGSSREAISVLQNIGYHYSPYRADVMHWFCKPSPSFRTHHLHLVPYGSRLWTERLAFRDCLRSDPTVAHDYVELKLRLAETYRFERESYTEAKGPFIERVLKNIAAAPTAKQNENEAKSTKRH